MLLLYFIRQVLSLWKDTLPDDYTVSDFVTEIQEWYNDDYLDDDVWKHLRKCACPEVVEGLRNREPVMVDEETQKLETLNNLKAARKKIT